MTERERLWELMVCLSLGIAIGIVVGTFLRLLLS